MSAISGGGRTFGLRPEQYGNPPPAKPQRQSDRRSGNADSVDRDHQSRSAASVRQSEIALDRSPPLRKVETSGAAEAFLELNRVKRSDARNDSEVTAANPGFTRQVDLEELPLAGRRALLAYDSVAASGMQQNRRADDAELLGIDLFV